MEKSYWLTYDLGVGGDYDHLYEWLDNHNAKSCGDSMAFFKYACSSENPDEELKKELLNSIALKPGNKLYIVRSKDNGIVGSFIYGQRPGAPWTGYGSTPSQSEDE